LTEPKPDYQTLGLPQRCPVPEAYYPCECCGHILGYKAHEGEAVFLYVFSYPWKHVRMDNEVSKPVLARISLGSVRCRRCGTWSVVE
jgi:hypothetical protein